MKYEIMKFLLVTYQTPAQKIKLFSCSRPAFPRFAILADQLTLFQPGGTDYAHLITTGTPGFLDLPTALQ